jgi:hypothetical protein
MAPGQNRQRGRGKDDCWAYASQLVTNGKPDRWVCKACKSDGGGGATRIKEHLAKCSQVRVLGK